MAYGIIIPTTPLLFYYMGITGIHAVKFMSAIWFQQIVAHELNCSRFITRWLILTKIFQNYDFMKKKTS